MVSRSALSGKITHALLVAAFSILAVLSLARCGGGGGSSDGVVPEVWNALEREFPDVETADINGDGAIDIAFIEKGLYWRLSLDPDGDVDRDYATIFFLVVFLQDPLGGGTFKTKNSYRLNPEALSLALDDLNHDGLVDVALSQKNANTLGVYLQNAGFPGRFLARKDFPAGDQPVGVAIGELNGDLLNDVAVAGSQLALLINDAASPGKAFSTAPLNFPGLTSIATADIDGDTRNDLVFTTEDTVTVLFQDPAPAAAGSYTSSDTYASGAGTAEVAVSDLNGDSLPDLAVANNENMNGRVSVFFQEPLAAGSFQPPVHYVTDTAAAALDIGNLNNDALPDLAVANDDENGGSVAVLLQNPLNHGTFLPAVLYPGKLGPDDVAIADLNQDGFSDLVVADKVIIIPNDNPQRWPYIRYQDAGNPGTFLEPVYLFNAL